MKKIIVVLILALIVGCGGQARAASIDHVWTNITSTSETNTKTWFNFKAMSVQGTFDNVTTGSVYISESANNNSSSVVLQGYSTTKSWKYNIPTATGTRTHVIIQYNNKSKMNPRKKSNVWYSVE